MSQWSADIRKPKWILRPTIPVSRCSTAISSYTWTLASWLCSITYEPENYVFGKPIRAPSQGRWLLDMPLRKRMKQISCGKQCESKNSTPEIDVMANAMLESPIHPREQMKSFGDMSENDHH